LRSRWALASSIGKSAFMVRAGCVSPLTPKNSTIKNRGQLLSFLFAAAPNRTMNLWPPFHVRPCLSMMFGMINTSDIFSIGETQVNVPRLVAGKLSANAGDSSNDSAQDGQLASGRSDAGLCRPGNRSGRIANFDRHLGSMGEGWSPAPTVRHVPFGHSPLALGRRRP
jgi:hypothetical protein